jgi:Phytoene/squalene synthetase
MASSAETRTVNTTMSSVEDLLRATSRSFYLTLRVLPGAVRPQISLAYLLARTSDTIADAQILSLEQRLEALQRFRARLCGEQPGPLKLAGVSQQEETAAERVLLQRADEVISKLQTFSGPDQQLIRDVLTTIISGQELDLRRFGAAAAQGGITALRTAAEVDGLHLSRSRMRGGVLDENVPRSLVPARAPRRRATHCRRHSLR